MKMNLIQIALAGASIVLVSLVGFARTNDECVADQWFDSYGDLSWEDEKAHLDNFAIALQNDSDSIGYIIVYAGRRSCIGEAKDRALRAKKYLVQTRAIEASRIKIDRRRISRGTNSCSSASSARGARNHGLSHSEAERSAD